MLRCHCRLFERLTDLDLRDLRDRRFALPLSQLASLPALRHLALPPLRKLESEALSTTKGFKLSKIRLAGSESLSTQQLSHFLATQRSLQKLDIGFCHSLDQPILEAIATQTHLYSLRLDGLKNLTDLSPLSRLPSLHKLILHLAEVDDDAFNGWKNTFPPLRVLDIQGTRTTEQVLQTISRISSLTRLHLAESSVSDATAPLLGKLHQLTNLNFVKCRNLFGAGYQAFVQNSKVERLELRSQPALAVAEWQFVTCFHLLKKVSIIDMQEIDDQVVSLFADMPHLSKFAASPNVISYQGVRSLSSCPITSLYLKSSGILDDRVAPILIDFFPHLIDLNLHSSPGVSYLARNAISDWSKSKSIHFVI